MSIAQRGGLETKTNHQEILQMEQIGFDESDCLKCNPFEGDFGNSGDRTLKDKIIKARKPGRCHLCGHEIKKGEYFRSRADIVDGSLMAFRWCALCCKAMALSWTDDGREYENRAALAKRHC